MEPRTRVLATLVFLVTISAVLAAVGTCRIVVLSADLSAFFDVYRPLERGADRLSQLAVEQVAAVEIPRRDSDTELRTRLSIISAELSSHLAKLDAVLAADERDEPEFLDLRRAIQAVRDEEASFGAATEAADANTLQEKSRGVQNAVKALSTASANLVARAGARSMTDERISIALLAGLATFSLALGALLARHALRVFSEVQTLRVLVPVCSKCHRVRSDPSFWRLVDHYLENRGHTQLAHGCCPSCLAASSVDPFP